MEIRTLTEAEIRTLIGPAEALTAVREAFVAFAGGQSQSGTWPVARDPRLPGAQDPQVAT